MLRHTDANPTCTAKVSAWMRSTVDQSPDGRLSLPAPALRLDVSEQRLDVEATQVTVRGDTVRLVGGAILVRGEPLELSASAVRLHAARVAIAGTLRCDTIEGRNFVARVYRTGAGNVW